MCCRCFLLGCSVFPIIATSRIICPYGGCFGALALWGVLSVLQVFLARDITRRLSLILVEAIAALIFFWRADPAILLTTVRRALCIPCVGIPREPQ